MMMTVTMGKVQVKVEVKVKVHVNKRVNDAEQRMTTHL